MAKNTMLKCKKFDTTGYCADPYEIWRAGDWEWRVLKKWQADDNKPFARWFCAVQSPMTYGGWDVGDCYAKDIMDNATKVEANNVHKSRTSEGQPGVDTGREDNGEQSERGRQPKRP